MLYYLFNIELESFKGVIPELEVKFSSIVLKNEYGDRIVKDNRKILFEKTDRDNEYLLFVEDNSIETEKFDYLFDEEYEIEEFNINFYFKDKELKVLKVLPNGHFTEKELLNDFLESVMLQAYTRNTLCIEGHKPNDMYGYDIEIKEYKDLAYEVANLIEPLIIHEEITHIFNGSDLGFDTVSFFAVEYLKKHGFPNLKNILVIPFNKIDNKWSSADKNRFKRMKSLADYVIYTDELKEYSIDLVPVGEYHELKNNKKSFFMIDNSKILLNNWNEKSGYINNVVSYAIRKGKIQLNINKK